MSHTDLADGTERRRDKPGGVRNSRHPSMAGLRLDPGNAVAAATAKYLDERLEPHGRQLANRLHRTFAVLATGGLMVAYLTSGCVGHLVTMMRRRMGLFRENRTPYDYGLANAILAKTVPAGSKWLRK